MLSNNLNEKGNIKFIHSQIFRQNRVIILDTAKNSFKQYRNNNKLVSIKRKCLLIFKKLLIKFFNIFYTIKNEELITSNDYKNNKTLHFRQPYYIFMF